MFDPDAESTIRQADARLDRQRCALRQRLRVIAGIVNIETDPVPKPVEEIVAIAGLSVRAPAIG